MNRETRRRGQLFLAALLAVTALRTAWILYERRQPAPAGRTAPAARPVNPDFYVYPPKSYLTDLASARSMKGQTVWIRDGWRYPSLPYDPAAHRSRRGKNPSLMAPLAKITIDDVVAEPSARPGANQVLFAYHDPSMSPAARAVAVGGCTRNGQDCHFSVDDMFFLKDPRQLYSHWSADTWKALENHEVREGMTEAQVSLALGFGRYLHNESLAADTGERVLVFRPPGQTVTVTFNQDGYARLIMREGSRK